MKFPTLVANVFALRRVRAWLRSNQDLFPTVELVYPRRHFVDKPSCDT